MQNNTGLGNLVENKNELVSNTFDIFSPNLIEKAMLRGYEQEIHPTSSLNSNGPFEFFLPGSTDYLSLPHTRLYIKGKITTEAGGVPANDVEYSVVNLFPQALFRQVDVHIGGINTSSQDQMYPYKSFFETLFSYSDVAKAGHLKGCSAWVEDSPGLEDRIGVDNNGYTTRAAWVEDGRVFDFCIPIHADIFQCPRLIPPNTPIKICFTRSPDAFSLMCAEATNVKIELTHLSLFVRKIVPTDHISNMYASHLEKKPVILPFSRSIIKRDTIAQGTTNVHLPLFNGELPRSILLCMVSSARLDGRKHLSPFVFNHFNVRYVNLRVNGLSEPCRPFEPNFATGLFTRELR
jgi:hypothetical protein